MKAQEVARSGQPVTYLTVLDPDEAKRLYWALADAAGPFSDRRVHPRRAALYELFDALYEALEGQV